MKAANPAAELGKGRTLPRVTNKSKESALINSTDIRALSRADLPAVAAILDATGLFPAVLLSAMSEPFLSGSADDCWLVVCDRELVIGFAFSERERMTDATHNLLAIAVLPDRQKGGVGKRLVTAIKQRLAGEGGRLLIVETSSLEEYAPTRAFYHRLGFAQEVTIRDFYAEGEDKIVFWSKL